MSNLWLYAANTFLISIFNFFKFPFSNTNCLLVGTLQKVPYFSILFCPRWLSVPGGAPPAPQDIPGYQHRFWGSLHSCFFFHAPQRWGAKKQLLRLHLVGFKYKRVNKWLTGRLQPCELFALLQWKTNMNPSEPVCTKVLGYSQPWSLHFVTRLVDTGGEEHLQSLRRYEPHLSSVMSQVWFDQTGRWKAV